MDKSEFQVNRKALLELFSHGANLRAFMEKLKLNMKEAAAAYKFERAAYYKNLLDKLSYVDKALFNYEKLLNKHIILKLDIRNGYKLFYITKGEVINKERFVKLKDGDIDKEDLEDFILRSREKLALDTYQLDEKGRMDFIQIIYSEIESLPEENLIILD